MSGESIQAGKPNAGTASLLARARMFGSTHSRFGAAVATTEDGLCNFRRGIDALLVLVFANEIGAAAGTQVLRTLHAEGTLTLYATAIISRQAKGTGMTVRKPVAEGESAAAPAVGAAVGTLTSLLGGPVTAAARTVPSALLRAVRDLDEQGLDAGFLEQVSTSLQPGKEAVIAETEEEREIVLESCIAALAGYVHRYRLAASLAEERLVQKILALRTDLAVLRTEWSSGEQPDAVTAMQRSRIAELQKALKQAEDLASALRREGAAKVEVLCAQAAQLESKARIAVEHRAARVRTRLETRAARLDHVAATSVASGLDVVFPGGALTSQMTEYCLGPALAWYHQIPGQEHPISLYSPFVST